MDEALDLPGDRRAAGDRGVVWILQGLNLLGQSGGMNGQHIWALIGVICALAGLGFIAAGVRAHRGAARMPGSR
jgi:hypothetical protein